MKKSIYLKTLWALALMIMAIGCKDEASVPIESPTVSTSPVTAITSTSAASGGNASNDGNAQITSRGIVWSTTSSPTVSLTTKTDDGSGTGSFTSSMSGLTPSTDYFVRAYAINEAGTSYGSEVKFQTAAPPASLATITTTAITNIASTTATGGGNVTADGNGTITARGLVWSTTTNPTITLTTKTSDGTGTGAFTSALTGLVASTTYFVRAYATNSAGTAYGNEVSFQTAAPGIVLPTITTTAITNITSSTASSGGNVTAEGSAAVTSRGIVWDIATAPTVSLTTKTSDGTGSGVFASSITGLTVSTTYFVRAYAISSAGTAYGNEISFQTMAPGIVLPTLTTTAITSITSSAASSGGNVNDEGSAAVTSRGIVWGIATAPTISLATKTSDGTGSGVFMSAIAGLTPSTTYFVRAYATSSAGTAYGNEISFVTAAPPVGLATLTTTAISAITTTTASSGGNVTSDGGASVTIRGIVWSTSASPTVSLTTKTSAGVGTGIFTSAITSLTASTTYFVRAYATNSAGTAYGNEVTFQTSAPAPVVPTVTTAAITNITSATATGGGEVTSDGNASVTARGIVWSQTINPTISSPDKTTNGTGTGSFTSSLSSLAPGATYFVRAYATNSVGTAYGNEVSFAAAAVLPILTTANVASIASTTASSGGDITFDGGAPITARGVVWSASAGPTISLTTKTSDGTGDGPFSSSMTGLSSSTQYFVRAYATNSAGTTYGYEVSLLQQR